MLHLSGCTWMSFEAFETSIGLYLPEYSAVSQHIRRSSISHSQKNRVIAIDDTFFIQDINCQQKIGQPPRNCGWQALHDDLHEEALCGMIAVEVSCPHKLHCMDPLLTRSSWVSSSMHCILDAMGHAAKVSLHCCPAQRSLSVLIVLNTKL